MTEKELLALAEETWKSVNDYWRLCEKGKPGLYAVFHKRVADPVRRLGIALQRSPFSRAYSVREVLFRPIFMFEDQFLTLSFYVSALKEVDESNLRDQLEAVYGCRFVDNVNHEF